MKKTIFSCIIVLAAITGANAQQISVVSGSATKIYTDLNLAIQSADAGSTVYLSGGGFQINDTTKIKKKLTIIGIGHKANNDNADGNTVVSGNFFFESGSDGSTVMGLYLSGNVNIGTSENAVNNFLVRYCNVNSIQVGNSNCQNILINQNYLRTTSHGGNSSISFTNNILHSIRNVTGGIIGNNVIRHTVYHHYSDCIGCTGIYCNHVFLCVSNSQIKNNIFVDPSGLAGDGVVANNMLKSSWGDNSVVIEDWADVFVGPDNGVNPTSNFHLKGTQGKNAGTDGTDIGIYGGSGFSDTALPPGPRIVSKKIAEQTDANGNLHIEIQVSAQ